MHNGGIMSANLWNLVPNNKKTLLVITGTGMCLPAFFSIPAESQILQDFD